MDEMLVPSAPPPTSALAALTRLLSAEEEADVSFYRQLAQGLQLQPWLGAAAAALPNSSMHRRHLLASCVSVALSSLRRADFESAYLAALDAAHYALDDGLESDWALDGGENTGLEFRNTQSDSQLSGAAVAVAAVASAAGTACASVRSDFHDVSSLISAAKRILCPNPHQHTAPNRTHSASAAVADVVDCDSVHAGMLRLTRSIFDARDSRQRCEASLAASSIVRQIARLTPPLFAKRPMVALLACATGGYKQFIAPMVASARKHFLASCCDLKFVIFTDNTKHEAFSHSDIVALPRNHGGWPAASLGRTASYMAHAQEYAWADYVFATDIDVKFTRAIGSEILGRTVGTLHADNAFYRGDERTGHYTVCCVVCCAVLAHCDASQAAAATHDSSAGMMWRQHAGGAAVLTRAVYEPRAQR